MAHHRATRVTTTPWRPVAWTVFHRTFCSHEYCKEFSPVAVYGLSVTTWTGPTSNEKKLRQGKEAANDGGNKKKTNQRFMYRRTSEKRGRRTLEVLTAMH